MSVQEEFEKALKHVGIRACTRRIGAAETQALYETWIPNTYVFKEPEKAPSPQPDEPRPSQTPKIDIDEMRRIGATAAFPLNISKGVGSFNTGMSIRMWLAGQAMNGMIAAEDLREGIARAAFTFADDMILESLK